MSRERDKDKVKRLAKYDAIRTEVLKDYYSKIRADDLSVVKYSDFSVVPSLYSTGKWNFKRFYMLTFFSEEERAHFADLRSEWIKKENSRFYIWYKIFNHLFLQKFIVPPVSAVWYLCETVGFFFGSFK